MKPGDCFGMLKVTPDRFREDRRTYFIVLCCCGNQVKMRDDHIRKKKHCGCLTADLLKWCKRTHGLCYTPEYFVWAQMWSRCTNPNQEGYLDYGGRGITVCDSWNSFEQFILDMGPRPDDSCEIDRRDNDREYCLENCRWTTRKVNSRNTRRNVFITYDGKTQTVAAWAEEVGIAYHVLARRVRCGWSDEAILLTPVNEKFSQYAKRGRRGYLRPDGVFVKEEQV